MAKFDPGWEGYPVWYTGLPSLAGHPTYHVNVIKLKWEIIWIGGLPHLPGPPPPCKQALTSLWNVLKTVFRFHSVRRKATWSSQPSPGAPIMSKGAAVISSVGFSFFFLSLQHAVRKPDWSLRLYHPSLHPPTKIVPLPWPCVSRCSPLHMHCFNAPRLCSWPISKEKTVKTGTKNSSSLYITAKYLACEVGVLCSAIMINFGEKCYSVILDIKTTSQRVADYKMFSREHVVFRKRLSRYVNLLAKNQDVLDVSQNLLRQGLRCSRVCK